MKYIRSLLPNLKAGITENPSAKKAFSVTGKTLAVAMSLFLFTSAHVKQTLLLPELDEVGALAALDEAATEGLLNGLSRERNDFNKAISLLADAATRDEQMAAYLTRVEKRVKGNSSVAESGSGIRVARSRKRASASERATAPVAAAATVEPLSSKSAWNGMKDFVNDVMVAVSSSRGEAKAARPGQTATLTAASANPTNGQATGRLTTGDIAFEMNPEIERWVDYYNTNQVGRRTMTIGIRRSATYLDMARAEFRRLGVPQDLVWLAFVESVWHPGAMSAAAAGGIWQFIPKTATEYGLTVGGDNDERFDPAKQTRVAATYLRDLHTIFGDWALAMAAYNCGEPRVMDAIIKNGRANFWEISDKQLLPKETRNYVPKILAAIKVAGGAESYGFSLDTDNLIGEGR